MAPAKGIVLAGTDYPLYSVASLDVGHFLVAGGGGESKTGVPNSIEVFQIDKAKNGLVAKSLCRKDTGVRAVMNSSIFHDGRNHMLATGEDELCHTYSVKYKVVTEGDNSPDDKQDGVRQRKSGKGEQPDSGKGNKKLTFEINKIDGVTTDFDTRGGYQKCVQFSLDGKLLATGGADGFLRVWKCQGLEKVFEVKAHKNEINDLDISPDGLKIITVSRDKNGVMWSSKDGKKITELVWTVPTPESYTFKASRYGLVENKKDKFNFFTVNVPVQRTGKFPSFISLWDSGKYSVKSWANVGNDIVSAFTVSPDGIYLGVGYMAGSVSVYISFSLRKLYHVKEVHSIFVTSIAFLPYSKATLEVTGAPDFKLLSVSADKSIRLHECPERMFINPVWIILAFVVIIYLFFQLLVDYGL